MSHRAFEDQATEPELGFRRVRGVLFESIGWGNVEDELVLEAVEDYYDETGDAAEGESVGPEAASLELTGSSSDVDGFGLCGVAAGGGEEAEEIWGEGNGRWWGFDRREEERGGAAEEEVVGVEMGSEAERETCGGHCLFWGLEVLKGFWSFWEFGKYLWDKQLT